MAIFFLLVGSEIELEIFQGELSITKKVSLPVLPAFGGIFLLAIIHLTEEYYSNYHFC
jgi:NhaA family Na+:H+ antiporter